MSWKKRNVYGQLINKAQPGEAIKFTIQGESMIYPDGYIGDMPELVAEAAKDTVYESVKGGQDINLDKGEEIKTERKQRISFVELPKGSGGLTDADKAKKDLLANSEAEIAEMRRQAEEYKARAQEEALKILEQAHKDAETIVSEAEDEALKVMEEQDETSVTEEAEDDSSGNI